MSDPKNGASERSVDNNNFIQNHSSHPLLRSKRSEKMLDRRNRNKIFVCFCLGFILSTIIALIAYGLTQGIFEIRESLDNNIDFSPVCGKRIIGYYTDSEATDITTSQLLKLTHAVLANVQMNSNGTLQFKDGKTEQRFMSMKHKANRLNVKVMFSIGGQDKSQHFAPVIQNTEKKSIFIQSIASFLDKYHLDGVDLFWKWPKTWDKPHYTIFLKELKQKLREQEEKERKEYILSIAIPPAMLKYWKDGYDFDEILDYVDFINVFSMDYHGPFTGEWPTGPSAPLYSGVDPRKNYNVDWTMKYYTCKTKQANKFNIVIPFYARLWKNVKQPVETGKEVFRLVDLKDGKIEGNSYMSRRTVKRERWDLSHATWDEESKSSYIFDPIARIFLTFETEKSIAAKTNYVNEKNFGGVWIWAVDMDDNKNSLLDIVYTASEFCSPNKENTVKYEC